MEKKIQKYFLGKIFRKNKNSKTKEKIKIFMTARMVGGEL